MAKTIKVKRSAALLLVAVVEAQAYIEDRDTAGLADLLVATFDGKLTRYSDPDLVNELYELDPEGIGRFQIVSERSRTGLDTRAPFDLFGIEQ